MHKTFNDRFETKYNRAIEQLYRFTLRHGTIKHRANPAFNYQPLPWIGLEESRRTEGTVIRWNQMHPHLAEGSSFLDIGCNVGYFVFRAAEKGCLAWGIEVDPAPLIAAEYVKTKADFPQAQFFQQCIGPDNVGQLPSFDYISLLSVFHHWCRVNGYDTAREMLGKLVSKTRRGFFFEMGQNEMDPVFQVPELGSDPRSAIATLLKGVSSRPITWLGENTVEVNQGRSTATRHLFLIGPAEDA